MPTLALPVPLPADLPRPPSALFDRLCLFVTRFGLSAWVGASLFFFSVGIRPMRSNLFDSLQKAQITQLIFPGYYQFGFTLLGLAAVSGLILLIRLPRPAWAVRLVLLGIVIALGCLIADRVWIYPELARMMIAELTQHVALPANFVNYHTASRTINSISLAGSLLAALAAVWPSRTA